MKPFYHVRGSIILRVMRCLRGNINAKLDNFSLLDSVDRPVIAEFKDAERLTELHMRYLL